MPAVGLGAADDVIEPAVAQPQVAVLEEAIDRVGQEVARDYRRRHAEQHERHGVERELQHLLERMEAADIEHVEQVGRVMHFVQPPQRHESVAGAVQPVAHEVDRQHHQHHLRRDRPRLRPDRAGRMGVSPVGHGQRQREDEQPRHRHLHHQHERGVGAHVAPGGLPVPSRRIETLQHDDADRHQRDRDVGRRQQRQPVGEQRRVQRDGRAEEQRIPQRRQQRLTHSRPRCPRDARRPPAAPSSPAPDGKWPGPTSRTTPAPAATPIR